MKLITRIVLLASVLVLPALASAGTYVSITVAPPPLPVYAQPVCPGDGYIWTPGYWAWDGVEYYWVPGTWVLAPAVNVFWTPGYWAWSGGFYNWHAGYWGPHVGFYGGVNYGFGYTGVGYAGGRWEHGSFHYNRAVNNINVVNVHNTYNTTIINNNSSRVSFNGGDHGTRARPSATEIAAAHDHHMGPTSVQQHHVQAARDDRSLRFSQNGGNPVRAAVERPFAAGARANVRAPDQSSSRPAMGSMRSSGFAPHPDHADRGRVNAPAADRVNGAVNGSVSPAARPSRGGEMPSSSYAPRDRGEGHVQQQGPRPEAPRAPQMNAPMNRPMNGPASGGPAHQRMGGGEMRHNEGPRPQQGPRREER